MLSVSPLWLVSVPSFEVCHSAPGEIISDFMTVAHNPDGLRQLISLPAGSAEAEVGGFLPLVQVYDYLETTSNWGALGENIQEKAADIRQRIQDGEEALRRH